MSRTDLTERLEDALRTVADRAEVTPPPFDLHRRPSVTLPEEAGAGRRRLRWVAAAAVLLVVAAAVVLRPRGDDPDPVNLIDRNDDPEGVPDGALAPLWVPDGMELHQVRWQVLVPRASTRRQLFGDPEAGPAVLLSAHPRLQGPAATAGFEIRGGQGWLREASDAAHLTIGWNEGEYSLTAEIRGLSTDAAVAFLDSLTRQADGFTLPADGDPALRSVVVAESGPDEPTIATDFVYGDGSTRVRVRAEVPRDGGTTTSYLLAYWSGRVDGGPTGHDVKVAVVGGPSPGDEVIERLADSVEPVDAQHLRGLRREAAQRAESGPLIAEARFPEATVEIRGDAGLTLVCLRVPGQELRCDEPTPIGVGVLVDGRWYVVGAVNDASAVSIAPTIPMETKVAGAWTIVLAEIPAGVDEVVLTAGPTGVRLTRPAS